MRTKIKIVAPISEMKIESNLLARNFAIEDSDLVVSQTVERGTYLQHILGCVNRVS